MITIEQKLKLFTKIVIDKQNSEYEDLIRDIDKSETEALDAYKKELAVKSIDFRNELIEKAVIEKKRLLSNVKVEKKKSILNKKSQIVKEVIEELKLRASKFTDEDSYKSFLFKLVEKMIVSVPNETSFICYLSEKDTKRYGSEILKIFNNNREGIEVTIKEQAKDEIGGVILFDSDERYKIDSCLKSMIEENEDLIGKRVNKVLNKAGDKRE